MVSRDTIKLAFLTVANLRTYRALDRHAPGSDAHRGAREDVMNNAEALATVIIRDSAALVLDADVVAVVEGRA